MRLATINTHAALRKFYLYSHNTARFSSLQGDSQQVARADILTTLLGRTVSKSAATANKLKTTLITECGIDTTIHCPAKCEALIREYCENEFGNATGMRALKW